MVSSAGERASATTTSTPDVVHVVMLGGPPLLHSGISAALTSDRRLQFRGYTTLTPANEVALASDGRTGAKQAAAGCDVLILHTASPRRDLGLVLGWSAAMAPVPRLLVLTENDDLGELVSCTSFGADGYALLPDLHPDELCAGVVALAQHRIWLCPTTIARLLEAVRQIPHLLATRSLEPPHARDITPHANATGILPDLGRQISDGRQRTGGLVSDRELEVLRRLARGAGEQDISAELHLTRNTVKTYLRRICEKLGVATRSEALRVAVQRGLIPDRRSAA